LRREQPGKELRLRGARRGEEGGEGEIKFEVVAVSPA